MPKILNKYLLLITLLILYSEHIFCQTSKIDSLIQIATTASEDTLKVNVLNGLAWEYYELRDKRLLEAAEAALLLSEKLGFKKGKATSLQNMGLYYTTLPNEGEKALEYFLQSRELFSGFGDKAGVASSYNNTGLVFLNNSEYSLAMEAFQESIDIYESTGNKRGLANSILNKGIAYNGISDLPKALEHFFKSLEIFEEASHPLGAADALNMISILYSRQNEPRKSIEFGLKTLEIYTSLNNRYNIALAYNNLGINYKKLEHYDKAIECYDKAGEIFNEVGELKGEVSVWHNLGELFRLKKQFPKALEYYDRSLKEGKKVSWKYVDMVNLEGKSRLFLETQKPGEALKVAGMGLEIAKQVQSLKHQLNFHELLYNSHKALNQIPEALRYLELSFVDRDSLNNLEKVKTLKELQTRYETDKKEQEIALLNKDNVLQASEINRKSFTQNILIGATLTFGLIGFLMFRNYRINQRSKSLLLNEQLKVKQFEAEKLAELNEVKSRFFSNIAHEFRTPLTLILGPLENLLEDTKQEKDANPELLGVAKNNAHKLLSLINQLLELSRLETGVVTTKMEKEDIVALLRINFFSFLSLAEQKDILLSFNSDRKSCWMDFDKDKVEKIMNNLISNAFKFTAGPGKISVNIFLKENNYHQAQLWVSVHDTGSGIAEDQLPHVFERFYQAKNTTNVEGSGIGLALAKELIELHKGTIKVESQPGEGSCFSFCLPLVGGIAEQGPAIGKEDTYIPEKAKGNFPENPPENFSFENSLETPANEEIILVIEDNDDVRNFIVDSLSPYYQLLEAPNGIAGLETAMDKVPDLIISDVMMPEMDGYETCKRLKAEEKTSHIPVILLTAKAGLESKLEGLDTGADDYLAKPFNSRELLARIKNLIALRKNLRKKYLAHAVSAEPTPEIAPIENAFLKKIREAIEAHLDEEDFSIEELSKEIGMSRTQVHRKLKALTNQSASRFIRIIRLNHAEEILKQGEFNVSEVAYQVGFNSSTYFSSCFTEHFGYAPSEIKKNR